MMSPWRARLVSALTAARQGLLSPLRWLNQFHKAGKTVSTRITREGLNFLFMIALILVVAVLKNVNLLVILAGTLLAMLLIQWRVCAKTLADLSVDRQLPRSIHARRPFEIELILRNPKSWLGAWMVLLQDRMVYAPIGSTIHRASQSISLLFASVTPKSSRSQRYRCVADRRGRYQWIGIELTTRFPLGLMRGVTNQKELESFVVQPALGRLQPSWKELFNVRQVGAKHRRVRALSDEGEFFGLRSYRPGDSKRWIHWRSSARRDELVVKQFQQPESRELIVLLDLMIPSEFDKEARKNYIKVEDTAVEFVATLAHQMTSGNIGSISVAIADAQPTVASRVAGRAQSYFLLERLAHARGGTQSQLLPTLRLLEREHRFVDHLIVISTRAMPNQVNEAWDHSAHRSGSLKSSSPQNDTVTPFWRSFQWINVSAGETAKYFVPAE